MWWQIKGSTAHLLPQHFPPYLPVEHGPHDSVKRVPGKEVVHIDRGGLPNAVGSILSLLHVTGVPVELGKHHMAGSSKGQTLEKTHTHTEK